VPPEPSGGATATAQSAIERLIARDRAITLGALVAVIGLAWWWLFTQPMAAAGSSPAAPQAMPGMAPMPAMAAAPQVWSLSYLGATFVMWALMMVAMMLPSAAPMILLFGRFARQSAGRGVMIRTGVFALSYLAIWALFSAVAALLQALLISTGVVSAMALAVGNGVIAAALLLVIAIYQLTGLKRICLDQCRSPLAFLMRLWRPGLAGAIRLGVAHGGYCLGCCWALMLLLFVGGVMNLAWIAVIALLVLAEKLAPPSARTSQIIAAVLIGGAIALTLAK
jgi:predicted metal-binding membrane protein